MSKVIKPIQDLVSQVEENTIRVTMYLQPEIFIDSEVVTGAVHYDEVKKKYYTDVNPNRVINGPLSDYGQQLQPPISTEYQEYINDCVWLIKENGFTIIKQQTSTDSQKSEYIVVFGIGTTPCGSIIYEIRLSDHPFDASFPESWKSDVLKYLKMNKILDGSATEAGINFWIEKVTVGSVKNDTWGRAFDRLADKLDTMRRKIKRRLKLGTQQ